jgi:hypothetical protein
VGDEPASVLVFVKNGQQIATIRRTWSRRARTWVLEHQETTTADGSYRDIIDVKRSGTPPQVSQAVFNALDLSTLRGATVPAGSAFDPFVAAFDLVDCNGYDGSDACAIERNNLANADDEVDLAVIELVIACSIPEPFEPVACDLAMAHLVGRVVIQSNAREALRKCEAKAAQKARCCNATSRMPTESGAMMSISPTSISPAADEAGCEVDANGDPAGDGSGGGTSGGTLESICYYWVIYDVDTGEILAIHLDHCETYMI